MRDQDPDIGHHAGSAVARHRAGATPVVLPEPVHDGRRKPVRIWLRLSLIALIGVVLTGAAVEITSRLHPVDPPSVVGGAPSPRVSASASDPAWTVPGPSASPSPAPTRSAVATRRTSSPTPGPGPTAELLGPDDAATLRPALTAYCQKTAGDTTVAVPSDDGSWSCLNVPDDGGTVDMDAMCGWFYGEDAWSMSTDDEDPYGYRCYQD